MSARTSAATVSQWFTAAEQPPYLAAIAPWEGFSDLYQDSVSPVGIPDAGFMKNVAR
jgi:hypothetical protein